MSPGYDLEKADSKKGLPFALPLIVFTAVFVAACEDPGKSRGLEL